MGKKPATKKAKVDDDLDSILAEVKKIDAKKPVAAAAAGPQLIENASAASATAAPASAAAAAVSDEDLANLKWKSKKEMDALIKANKDRKNWPAEQTTPEPTVPIVKMFHTPSEAKAKQLADGATAAAAAPEAATAEAAGGKKKAKKGSAVQTLPPCGEEVVEFERLSKERELEKELAAEQFQEQLWNARIAAQCHKSVRKWLRGWVKPGMTMQYITETTENKVRELLCADGLDGGIGFPMGCSLNEVAAHYTPNGGDPRRLGVDDVVKFDIGVHYKGRIIDSAFTMCWNDRYQPLLQATREATNCGVAMAAIDVRLADIGEAIQEVMESHEIELNGKTYKIKCVENLCGHNILPYRIHGGKSVPIVKVDPRSRHAEEYNKKMEEFEFFAIETFSSTGKGHVRDEGDCSHFALDPSCFNHPGVMLSKTEQDLYELIKKTFGTLPWARRYVDRLPGIDAKYPIALKGLVNKEVVLDYPPLVDMKGCYTGQFEHTLVLRPTAKEVLSRSDDY